MESIANLQARLLAERQTIMEELGLTGGPVRFETPLRSSSLSRRSSTRSSEKRRRAVTRSAAAIGKARQTQRRRRRLGANLQLLAEAGALPAHHRVGAPLAPVEGKAYHGASRRVTRKTK